MEEVNQVQDPESQRRVLGGCRCSWRLAPQGAEAVRGCGSRGCLLLQLADPCCVGFLWLLPISLALPIL